jgi:hypothetical protein
MEAGFVDAPEENYIFDKNPGNIAAIFYMVPEICPEFLYFLDVFQIVSVILKG